MQKYKIIQNTDDSGPYWGILHNGEFAGFGLKCDAELAKQQLLAGDILWTEFMTDEVLSVSTRPIA